jgi:hypothetical protein
MLRFSFTSGKWARLCLYYYWCHHSMPMITLDFAREHELIISIREESVVRLCRWGCANCPFRAWAHACVIPLGEDAQIAPFTLRLRHALSPLAIVLILHRRRSRSSPPPHWAPPRHQLIRRPLRPIKFAPAPLSPRHMLTRASCTDAGRIEYENLQVAEGGRDWLHMQGLLEADTMVFIVDFAHARRDWGCAGDSVKVLFRSILFS